VCRWKIKRVARSDLEQGCSGQGCTATIRTFGTTGGTLHMWRPVLPWGRSRIQPNAEGAEGGEPTGRLELVLLWSAIATSERGALVRSHCFARQYDITKINHAAFSYAPVPFQSALLDVSRALRTLDFHTAGHKVTRNVRQKHPGALIAAVVGAAVQRVAV
jgi:hypothetical protein